MAQQAAVVDRVISAPCGEVVAERPARVADPSTMVIFGATGDLAKRKLLPALYNLNAERLLPDRFAAIGGAREGMSFTLDHDIGEFLLTHPDIRCPEAGAYYSANLANMRDWDTGTQEYIRRLATSNDPAHSLRHSGALVADVHRSLLEGGIYLYPGDRQHPGGTLRLVYECAPLAFVVEQAGGSASTGTSPVLDTAFESIDHRVPFAVGSRNEVAMWDDLIRAHR
jgi:fructose-1,6-bisphosphatase